MFHGLTWFGIPLEYVLRAGELFTIIFVIFSITIVIYREIKEKQNGKSY